MNTKTQTTPSATEASRGRARRLSRILSAGAALAVGLLLAPQASAQGSQDRPDRPERPRGEAGHDHRGPRMDPAQRLERRMTTLTERLQLTARQQTQVRSILTTQLFFPGEARNASDGIFHASLLMQLSEATSGMNGKFNFVLDLA